MITLKKYSEFDRFFDGMFNMLDQRFTYPQRIMRTSPSIPNINIRWDESGDEHIVYAVLPGYSAENINIEVSGNLLTIESYLEESETNNLSDVEKSNASMSDKEKDLTVVEDNNIPNKKWYMSEFKKTYRLPDNVQTDEITASMDKGILTIKIPKSIKVSKKINIV